MPLVSALRKIGFNPIQSKHLGFDAALSLTATGNNSQADAYQITANWNQFTVVTSTNNSAKLMSAASSGFGQIIVSNDDSADTLYLYPANGESFNSLAANTAISITAGSALSLVKVSSTQWIAVLTSGSSASVTGGASSTTIDFGSIPVSEATFTITNASISSTHKIIPSMAYEAATGRDLDEVEMDSLDLKATAGSGQFTLYAKAIDGSYLSDGYVINYIWR